MRSHCHHVFIKRDEAISRTGLAQLLRVTPRQPCYVFLYHITIRTARELRSVDQHSERSSSLMPGFADPGEQHYGANVVHYDVEVTREHTANRGCMHRRSLFQCIEHRPRLTAARTRRELGPVFGELHLEGRPAPAVH